MIRIVFTEPAEIDLLDIEYYISVELSNHQAARRITDGIVDTVESLGNYPLSHPYVSDELLKSMGLRMTRFGNYNIFYVYDSETEVIYVIRILYNKVDWQYLLRN